MWLLNMITALKVVILYQMQIDKFNYNDIKTTQFKLDLMKLF